MAQSGSMLKLNGIGNGMASTVDTMKTNKGEDNDDIDSYCGEQLVASSWSGSDDVLDYGFVNCGSTENSVENNGSRKRGGDGESSVCSADSDGSLSQLFRNENKTDDHGDSLTNLFVGDTEAFVFGQEIHPVNAGEEERFDDNEGSDPSITGTTGAIAYTVGDGIVGEMKDEFEPLPSEGCDPALQPDLDILNTLGQVDQSIVSPQTDIAGFNVPNNNPQDETKHMGKDLAQLKSLMQQRGEIQQVQTHPPYEQQGTDEKKSEDVHEENNPFSFTQVFGDIFQGFRENKHLDELQETLPSDLSCSDMSSDYSTEDTRPTPLAPVGETRHLCLQTVELEAIPEDSTKENSRRYELHLQMQEHDRRRQSQQISEDEGSSGRGIRSQSYSSTDESSSEDETGVNPKLIRGVGTKKHGAKSTSNHNGQISFEDESSSSSWVDGASFNQVFGDILQGFRDNRHLDDIETPSVTEESLSDLSRSLSPVPLAPDVELRLKRGRSASSTTTTAAPNVSAMNVTQHGGTTSDISDSESTPSSKQSSTGLPMTQASGNQSLPVADITTVAPVLTQQGCQLPNANLAPQAAEQLPTTAVNINMSPVAVTQAHLAALQNQTLLCWKLPTVVSAQQQLPADVPMALQTQSAEHAATTLLADPNANLKQPGLALPQQQLPQQQLAQQPLQPAVNIMTALQNQTVQTAAANLLAGGNVNLLAAVLAQQQTAQQQQSLLPNNVWLALQNQTTQAVEASGNTPPVAKAPEPVAEEPPQESKRTSKRGTKRKDQESPAGEKQEVVGMGFFSKLQEGGLFDTVVGVTAAKKKKSRKKRKPKADLLEGVGMGFFSGQMATAPSNHEQPEISERIKPLYDWAPVLDERTRAVMEFSLPLVLPAVALLSKYSSFAWVYCFGLPILHTLEVLLTNFGPKASNLHFKFAPFTPFQHMCIDLVLLHPMCILAFACPDAFGPWAYVHGSILFFLEYIYWAVGYKGVVVTRREAKVKARIKAQ